MPGLITGNAIATTTGCLSVLIILYYNRWDILLEIEPLISKSKPLLKNKIYSMAFAHLLQDARTQTETLTNILIKQAQIEDLPQRELLSSYKKLSTKPHIGEGIEDERKRKTMQQQVFWKLVIPKNASR